MVKAIGMVVDTIYLYIGRERERFSRGLGVLVNQVLLSILL